VKAAPLSDGTKRWLRDASLTVAPAPEWIGRGPGPYMPGRMMYVVRSERLKNRVPYSAVVRNARGQDCSMMFQIQRGPVEKYNLGWLTVVCQ